MPFDSNEQMHFPASSIGALLLKYLSLNKTMYEYKREDLTATLCLRLSEDETCFAIHLNEIAGLVWTL